jgi:hypothetical protein
MLHPAHTTKLAFDFQQRRRHRSLFLIAATPVSRTTRIPFEAGHHAFDQIGGVQTLAEHIGVLEAMERQRFVEAIVQAAGAGAVDRLECWHQTLQRASGIVMPRVRVRRQLGVSQTPTFFVNGWRLRGGVSQHYLSEVVEALLRGQKPRGAVDSAGTARRQRED